jgi:opacity protein-like surface antigen
MPGVSPTSGSYIKGTLNSLQAQITALATQQNQSVMDNNQITRVKIGWQSDNNTYGVTILDSSGNKRVVLGELPNGDHGIELLDTTGNTQELLPALDDYVSTTLSTTSGTPVTLTGSPTVNIDIGANGDCEITAGAFVGYPTAGSATAYLAVDLHGPYSIFGMSGSSAGAGNVQSTRRISTWIPSIFPLSPGTHAFNMLYEASGGTGNFSANYLKVQPL